MHDINSINYTIYGDYWMKAGSSFSKSIMLYLREDLVNQVNQESYSSGWILKNITFIRRIK